MPNSQTPWNDLAGAIILQAVEDYRSVCYRLLLYPLRKPLLEAKQDLEDFFRSSWFRTLSGLDAEPFLKNLQDPALFSAFPQGSCDWKSLLYPFLDTEPDSDNLSQTSLHAPSAPSSTSSSSSSPSSPPSPSRMFPLPDFPERSDRL